MVKTGIVEGWRRREVGMRVRLSVVEVMGDLDRARLLRA